MPETAEAIEKLEKQNLELKIELDLCIRDFHSLGNQHASLYAQRRAKELEHRLADICK
jgi:hypothetical protein